MLSPADFWHLCGQLGLPFMCSILISFQAVLNRLCSQCPKTLLFYDPPATLSSTVQLKGSILLPSPCGFFPGCICQSLNLDHELEKLVRVYSNP